MQVAAEIFKAYDIRGVYQETLDEAVATAVGQAFVHVVNPTQVVVGRDARVSSPSLHAALIESLLSAGVNVIDIGMVSTDMYYYACATKDLPGIMVTASHNPAEYNGFKMVRRIPDLLSGETGIQQMYQLISADEHHIASTNKGELTQESVMQPFVEYVLSLVDVGSLEPMSVHIDTANGMVGPTLIELFKHIPQITVHQMYFEPDGTFPNHGGDPLDVKNRAEIQQRVLQESSDLGFMFDPDGDRFFCIDSTGRFVSGDFMTALLAEYFLDKEPNATIVYDIRASHAVPNLVKAAGGRPLYNRVGHAYIKARMQEEDAVFGGEVTGHYYFKDFFFCDSGVAPMLYLLEMLSKSTDTLAEKIDQLESEYFISGEINTKGVDAPAIFEALKQKFSDAQEILEVDGVSVIYPEWHCNVRASNTEPLVRLNLEARNQELMEQKKAEVLALIKSHPLND